ncbi:MAG: PilZ domain-containing protein [Oleiphilaceae bacterium]|nr:PilZ domain-containing protein [Oleiphilaceae bacterium]
MSDEKELAARYAAVSNALHGKDGASKEASADERREFARRAARWAAKITTTKHEVVHCRTRDVSERGASVVSPYDFNMRAQILVEITITYKGLRKQIRAVGEVRHSSITSDGFAIGILFKEAPASTITFLRKYANHRL